MHALSLPPYFKPLMMKDVYKKKLTGISHEFCS